MSQQSSCRVGIDDCKHLAKNSSFDSSKEDNFKILLKVLEAKEVASEGWINECGKETDTGGRMWKSKVNLVQRIINKLHASTLPSSGERPLCSASSLWDFSSQRTFPLITSLIS